MFPLHETTQRKVCRLAFVMLCAVPTALLLTYALWLKTPLHRQAQASSWSRTTGTAVTVGHLLYPQPGILRLENVVLEHPQTRQPLARVREMEVARRGDEVTIFAAQPELQAAEIDELWRQIQRQLLDASYPAARSLRLRASDVTIQDGEGQSQTLTTLEVLFQQTEDGHKVTAKYDIAGAKMTQPAVVRIAHNGGQLTKFHWHTGEADLPVAPWAARLPWLTKLGDDCHFRGEISGNMTDHGLSSSITGELTQVDLDRLVSANFPHKLGGTARVKINARFEHDRLVELNGNVVAGPGVISDTLLQRAIAEWKLTAETPDVDAQPAKPLRRYKSLAFDFQINDGQLTLANGHGAAMLTVDDGQRWQVSSDATFNPASLIRVLAKGGDADVPATESSRQLIRWLPLAAEKASEAAEQPPKVHVRSGTDL